MNSLIQHTAIDFRTAQCFSLSTKLLVSMYVPNGKITITYVVWGKRIGMKISVEWLFESFSRERPIIQRVS